MLNALQAVFYAMKKPPGVWDGFFAWVIEEGRDSKRDCGTRPEYNTNIPPEC